MRSARRNGTQLAESGTHETRSRPAGHRSGPHYDTATLTARRRNEADDLLSSAVHGQFRATLTAATVPDLHLIGPQGQRTRGRDALADIMDSDLHAGVRQQLNQITAGNRITVLECDQLGRRAAGVAQ